MTYDESYIIQAIEAYSKDRGIATSTFCLRAVNDGKALQNLKAGGTITLRRARKIIEFIQKNPVDPQGRVLGRTGVRNRAK